jgi:salicylate hydroxylase
MQDVRVGVVGGGIGGLAAAVALCRPEFDVTVYEQAASLNESGSGLVLPPQALAALGQIDTSIGVAVQTAGQRYPRSAAVPLLLHTGTVLAADSFFVSGHDPGLPPMVTILRSDLHRMLQGAASDAGVTVRTSARVAGFVEDEREVTIAFADGESVSVDILIGADGLRSTVRCGLLGTQPPVYAGYASIRGVVPSYLDQYPAGFQTVAPGVGSVFTAALPSGYQYWNAGIAAPEGTWPTKTRRRAHGELRQLTRDWHDPIPDMIDAADAERLVITDIYDRDPIIGWGTARATLLGDAAHPTQPTIGQGAAMAIEDAALLGELLSAMEIPDALRQYAAKRGPVTADTVRQSRQVSERGGLSRRN